MEKTTTLLGILVARIGQRLTARRMTRAVTVWTQRRASRRALLQMDTHGLRDIGLDPHSAASEAHKPFWQD